MHLINTEYCIHNKLFIINKYWIYCYKINKFPLLSQQINKKSLKGRTLIKLSTTYMETLLTIFSSKL
jgi:hypothetical protein